MNFESDGNKLRENSLVCSGMSKKTYKICGYIEISQQSISCILIITYEFKSLR